MKSLVIGLAPVIMFIVVLAIMGQIGRAHAISPELPGDRGGFDISLAFPPVVSVGVTTCGKFTAVWIFEVNGDVFRYDDENQPPTDYHHAIVAWVLSGAHDFIDTCKGKKTEVHGGGLRQRAPLPVD